MAEELSRQATEQDLLRLATLHREAIQGGFLASLGDHFLVRLYKVLCRSPAAVVLVERRDDQIVGFIAAASSMKTVYRDFALSIGPAAILRLAPRVANRKAALKVAETALYPFRRRTRSTPSVEVLNFCVDASCRGQGVGRVLFDGLVNSLRDEGHAWLRIVTGAEQHSAQRFYASAGAIRVGSTEVHRGEASLEFEYLIPQAA